MNWLGSRRMGDEWPSGAQDNSLPPIHAEAFASALRGMGSGDLASELSDVAVAFEACRKLREDSNYESLVLAHQYWHGTGDGIDGFVYVDERMEDAVGLIREANDSVFSLVGRVGTVVFSKAGVDAGIAVLPSERSVDDQFLFLSWLVRAKLEDSGLSKLIKDNPLLASWRLDTAEECPPDTDDLCENIRFDRFGVKGDIMKEFDQKVHALEGLVRRDRSR